MHIIADPKPARRSTGKASETQSATSAGGTRSVPATPEHWPLAMPVTRATHAGLVIVQWYSGDVRSTQRQVRRREWTPFHVHGPTYLDDSRRGNARGPYRERRARPIGRNARAADSCSPRRRRGRASAWRWRGTPSRRATRPAARCGGPPELGGKRSVGWKRFRTIHFRQIDRQMTEVGKHVGQAHAKHIQR
jgi:hypothetical protein